MRGRKPVPTQLKIIRGNPGRRPLNTEEPQPKKEMPACPEFLDEQEKAKWNELCKELYDMGTLTKIDGDLLAMYCKAWVGFVKWDEIAKKSPMHVWKDNEGKITSTKRTAAVNLRDSYAGQVRSYGAELGLSPSARVRLKAEKPKETDAFGEFLRTGKIKHA